MRKVGSRRLLPPGRDDNASEVRYSPVISVEGIKAPHKDAKHSRRSSDE